MNTSTKTILAKNLRKFLDESGMSQQDFAKELNVAPSAVTQWLHEKTAPRADMLDKICRVLHINRIDLVLDNDALSKGMFPAKQLPLYNSIYSEKNFFEDSNIERYIAVDQSIDADFGIIISSQAMTGVGINPGDVGLFSKNYKFKDGNIYAVWLIGVDSAMLKRVYVRDNKYVFISENANMAPLIVENNEAFIMGELVGLYKKWSNEKEG